MARLVGSRPKIRRFLSQRRVDAVGRLPRRLLPADWVTGPPDFVGVGSQRSGTSWWYAAITSHPRVHDRTWWTPKELHHFDSFSSVPFTEASIERYHRLFPRPPGTIVGEWTPRYMHDFWTPALLARAAPDARLLVLLRDPLERYRSGLTGEVGNADVLRLAADAFQRGLYFAQLTRLFAHFDRERVLVLQFERCRDRPEEEIRRTYAFLDLDDTFVPPGLRRPVNASSREKVVLEAHVAEALREAYREDATRLFAEFPELDRGLWSLAV